MKPTVTPAYRPTPSSIRSSFRASGKRHLILTGGRGSGKTTLLAALCPTPLLGLTSRAVPGQGVWLTENLTGAAAQIGAFAPALPGPENRMAPLPALRQFGIAALARCAAAPGEWATIDEVGYLECTAPDYCAALMQLFKAKRVIAVVRSQPLPFLQQLCRREDAFVVDLDAPLGNLDCVIMASGLGRRFGAGTNKLLADFDGKPLFLHALDATEDLFAHRVVVTRHEQVAALCRARGVEVVLHDLPYRSDTVRLGLQAVGEADGCMFCPADQPLLRRQTVERLALCAVGDPQSIWRPAFGDIPGAPVLFPRWCFAALAALPQGKGGGAVILQHPHRVRTVPVQAAEELQDVDTPADLQRLQALRAQTI